MIQSKHFFCKFCGNLIITQFLEGLEIVLQFSNCIFESSFNSNNYDFKYVSAKCKKCFVVLAEIKWEFYTSEFEENKLIFSENVYIKPECLNETASYVKSKFKKEDEDEMNKFLQNLGGKIIKKSFIIL